VELAVGRSLELLSSEQWARAQQRASEVVLVMDGPARNAAIRPLLFLVMPALVAGL
jgi:hypothetical protein